MDVRLPGFSGDPRLSTFINGSVWTSGTQAVGKVFESVFFRRSTLETDPDGRKETGGGKTPPEKVREVSPMYDKDVILRRMELARTGTFGANGASITLQNLQDVVSLGHQMTRQDWWPSWGNVEALELIKDPNGTDGKLVGDVSLHPVVAKAVDDGFYPSWSVSIPERETDGKRYLHHLALLGAVPPAIRDLKIIATVRPDNAIDAKEAAFADQAFYSFADFPEAKEGDDMGQETKKPITPVPEQVPAKDKTAAAETEFSDTIKRQDQRMKGILKESARTKVKASIGGRWPAGKQDELTQFADALVDSHDFDFSDEGEGVSLVDSFIKLIESMSSAAPPKPGRMQEFSDAGTQAPKIDRGNLAQKF
jgi:hypothetical protein